MPLTQEERKNYNKTYYQTNKQKALEKASIRVTCVCCDRIVSKNRLLAHMKTDLCKRTQLTENYINDRLHNRTVEKQE
jgi:hypothetical protein